MALPDIFQRMLYPQCFLSAIDVTFHLTLQPRYGELLEAFYQTHTDPDATVAQAAKTQRSLRSRTIWIPSAYLEHALWEGDRRITSFCYQTLAGRLRYREADKGDKWLSVWLSNHEPASQESRFYEQRINHAALTTLVGSEVLSARYLFMTHQLDFQQTGQLLGRQAHQVISHPLPISELPLVPMSTPQDHEHWLLGDRYELWIDAETGCLLSYRGSFQGQDFICGKVETLRLDDAVKRG